MKKKMLATTLLTGLLAACSGNSASVTGVWIELSQEWKTKCRVLTGRRWYCIFR